jgi:hypothetical protein
MNMDINVVRNEQREKKMINYIEFSFQKKELLNWKRDHCLAGNINYKARSRFELNE